MSKWKCEICSSSFENFDARGFDNKIYCPLCYYKKLYKDTELEREKLTNIINELEKWLKDKDKNSLQDDNYWEVLDKLQELKGSEQVMSEDEISNLKLMICHLDLSVETKEKLYNQAHKIRNQLQQKENIIKEVREYIEKKQWYYEDDFVNENIVETKPLLEILDKESE